jgi:hypothetical protein
MEKGFVPDYSHGAILQPSWQQGEVVEQKFLGMKNGIKADRENGIPVIVYRCTHCGYLEFYAE